MKKGQKLLEELLRNEYISGFNRIAHPFDPYTSVLVLSNIHETTRYKKAVLQDVKEKDPTLQIHVHKKRAFTRWLPGWRIRDDIGKVLPNLKIKDEKSYLQLENIRSRTLLEAGFSQEYLSTLIGMNKGYELRIQSSDYKLMQDLAKLFREKTDPLSSNTWPDTYETPIILLFGLENIEGFLPVTMYQKREVSRSLNFVQRNLEKEVEKQLGEDGFEQAPCLANSLFVEECCNQCVIR